MTENVQANGNAKQNLLYGVWGEAWNDLGKKEDSFIFKNESRMKRFHYVQNVLIKDFSLNHDWDNFKSIDRSANNHVERHAYKKAFNKYNKTKQPLELSEKAPQTMFSVKYCEILFASYCFQSISKQTVRAVQSMKPVSTSEKQNLILKNEPQ